MRINNINGTLAANSVKAYKPVYQQSAREISFNGVWISDGSKMIPMSPDTFAKESAPLVKTSAKITPPSVDELIKSIHDAAENLQDLIPDHADKTAQISKRAVEIQNSNPLFKQLQEEPSLQNLKKIYEGLFNGHLKQFFGEDIVFPTTNVMFLSKDQKLAQDASDLALFYMKSSYDQSQCAKNFEDFYRMFSRGFANNEVLLAAPDIALKDADSCSVGINKLLAALRKSQDDYQKTGRPSVISVSQFDKFIDRDIDSHENICCMKRLMTNSTEKYKGLILFGAQDPLKASLEPGALKTHRVAQKIKLDELGVTPENIELLKKIKTGLTPQMEELDDLFKQINADDFNRMKIIHKSLADFMDSFESIEKQYPEHFTELRGAFESVYEKFVSMNVQRRIKQTVQNAAQETLDVPAAIIATAAHKIQDVPAEFASMDKGTKEAMIKRSKETLAFLDSYIARPMSGGKKACIVAAGAVVLGCGAYWIGKVFSGRQKQPPNML